jgi:tetratricopeptide (TPR) repeat protein
LFFAPFYYTTAWSYWKSNLYDVAPEQSSAIIENGFGKGINTNQVYKNLYEWISTTSNAYSKKDDYIISYVSSPMVHMIAQRRPATDDSYHAFDLLQYNHFDKVIEFIKSHKRKPQIAYVFEAMPALASLNIGNPPMIVWRDKQISFPSDDPLSRYVLANMTMIDSFMISNEFSLSVRCFIDNASALSALENKLYINPTSPELNLQMGNFYQTKRELDKAQKYYQKALDANPEFIPALMQLAINQSLKGNDLNAVIPLKRIVAIDPTRIEAYYNIACIYARRKQVKSSIVWLKKAVDNGFNKWELLQTDNDLENIRGTIYYKLLLKKYCNAQIKNN